MNLTKTAILAFALLVSGLYSCGGSSEKSGGSSAKEELTVGAVIPLTGKQAHVGRSMKRGFELAVEEINASSALNTKIRLTIKDGKSGIEDVAAGYGELVAAKVPVILGPYTSSATRFIIPVIHEAKTVAIGPTSAAQGLSAQSPYLFRTTLSVAPLVSNGVRVTKKVLGYENAATITNSSDTFSMSNYEQLKKAFRENGVRLVTEQSFSRAGNEDVPDLSAQLAAVKNADPPVQALFISALSSGRIGAIAQARKSGLAIPLAATLFTETGLKRVNEQLAGSSLSSDGVISFTNWREDIDNPKNKAFVASYTRKYGEAPDSVAARSYTSVRILAAALSRASGTGSDAIREALAGIRNLETPLGSFSFDENGDAVYSPVVEIVRNGKFEHLRDGG